MNLVPYYMAKTFSSLKQGLGLLDFIPIGKYKNCRVDSIIDMDDAYLRYMQHEKILQFDKSVMNKLTARFLDGQDVEYDEEEELMKEVYFDDVPF